MSKRFVSVGVVLGSIASLFWANSASAQEWLKDRRYQEGPGYRTGDLELHPGIAGELGYDSNWLLRSDKSGPNITNGAPALPPEGAGVMRITPSLTMSTIGSQRKEGQAQGSGPQNVEFTAGLAATYLEFFGSETIRKQRNVSGSANARLTILPGHPWGGAVFGSYGRTIQPTVIGNPDLSFNRDDVGVGVDLAAQPNSGTLDWHLGYQFHATLFEQSQGAIFNNQSHQIDTRGRWKFRPRTALLYDASLTFRNYSDTQGVSTALHNSNPARVRVGLNGLITPRFSLLAMAGWAATFFKTSGADGARVQQFDSAIAQVEAKFFPTSRGGEDLASASLLLSSIAVGYTRDYQFSYLGDYYGTDRGYARIAYFFAGRALLSLEGGVAAIEYPTVYFVDGTKSNDPFTDIRADATLFAEYRVLQTVGINTTLRYTENFSSTQLPTASAAAPGQENLRYDMSWRRFEAFLGVRWFM
jgi:hypothetical protein